MNNVYIIAEAGVNHNGSLEMAKRLVDVAATAKANAVKFQTFNTEDLVCLTAPKAEYQHKSSIDNESQFQMLKSLELNHAAQIELQHYCQSKHIEFLSSPFDLKSVDFLCRTLNVPLVKIASGEITNLPLLIKISQTGKPVILSTGMSTLNEIETALMILTYGYLYPENEFLPSLQECENVYFSKLGQHALQEKVSLLHCTSEYPAPFPDVNLRVIKTLNDAFQLPVGYSDHTLGIGIAIAAVACGATIIEKHFTLDKNLIGPDHQASLDPQELNLMVQHIREVESALGSSKKIPVRSELKNRSIARKSLVALKKISVGDKLTQENVGCKRPGNGISPLRFSDIQNTYAVRHYEPDELIGV